MSNALPKRHEVPVEHTWDLESVFATEDEWEAALQDVQDNIAALAAYKGRLAEGPATIKEFMSLSEKYQQIMGKVFVYANLQVATDTSDSEATARADRSRGLFARMGAATAFAQPELLAIGRDTIESWLSADSELAQYGHAFDQVLKRAAHIRSSEVEALLGQMQDPFRTASTTHGILHNSDIAFKSATSSDPAAEPMPVAQSTYSALVSHSDRTVRRTAFENYSDGYLQFKNTLANLMSTEVKQNVFKARVRSYGSALEAALAPSFLPTDVFHNTVNTFKENLPTWHRYWAIRRQALGYDTLHPYDTKAPLSRNSPVVSYQQSVDWICEGMKPLGADYVAALRKGCLEERWVDIYPNEGKRLGAFSAGVKGTHPFIFMSYTDDLFSMSTLAHELGHSLHSYYSRQNQPWTYSRYTLFEAEVASNFNQALTRSYLLDSTDDVEFQIAIIEEAMSNFYRYFFVMPTLARFELEIHERVERGQPLTSDSLIKLMAGLFAEGYGDEMELDHDRVGITWATFGHLYANFYVFQYTTGIAGAHALASDILAGDSAAVARYRDFLNAGGSRYPLANLQAAGVDLTSPQPVEKTFAVLADYVDRLEKLVAQR